MALEPGTIEAFDKIFLEYQVKPETFFEKPFEVM